MRLTEDGNIFSEQVLRKWTFNLHDWWNPDFEGEGKAKEEEEKGDAQGDKIKTNHMKKR